MSLNVGDRYLVNEIEYEVVDVRTETAEDGTIITVENAIPVV